MKLNDKMNLNPDTYGVFSIKSYDKDGVVIDDYTDLNLIVYTARSVMAGQIGAYVGTASIEPINKFVLGTRGHIGENILVPLAVGDDQPGYGVFSPERTSLYSEESGEVYYSINFNPEGGIIVTNENISGTLYEGTTLIQTDDPTCTIVREITGIRENEVKYTITIDTTNANKPGEAVAYTEAALYAGDNLFAMKTFPARVKENTVKFIITWSIIF